MDYQKNSDNRGRGQLPPSGGAVWAMGPWKARKDRTEPKMRCLRCRRSASQSPARGGVGDPWIIAGEKLEVEASTSRRRRSGCKDEVAASQSNDPRVRPNQ